MCALPRDAKTVPAPRRQRRSSGAAAAPATLPQVSTSPHSPTSGSGAAGPAATRAGRIAAIDWLRGLAVVLMILWHGYDAWLAPAAKTGDAYQVLRHLGAQP